MAFFFPSSMQKLVVELSKLPSVGEKSASRLAYHLINNDQKLALNLAQALTKAKEATLLCEKCFFFTEESLCTVCRNLSRDSSVVCVVEKPMDLIAIERVGEFKGLYHVLHGLLAPLRGMSPEKIKLKELVQRVKDSANDNAKDNAKNNKVQEVILATSCTVEGDATSLYIARVLGELGVKSTRLAQGMSKGAELEYADELTLSKAFSGRAAIAA